MKTNQTRITPVPDILFADEKVVVNHQVFSQSVVLNRSWQPTLCHVSTAKEWATHPMRQDCLQIISSPNISQSPELIDCFWQQMISVDLLPLDAAIRHAKSLIGDNVDFQLLLIPYTNQAQGI